MRNLTTLSLIVLIALTLTVSGWGDAQEGLIGYWPMDEGSGDKVADAAGNGHDGTAKNTKWVDGKYDKALEFNGKDSVVDIPFSADMTPSEGVTLAAWIFPTDTTRSCIVGRFGAYGMALLDGLKLKSVIWGDDWVIDVTAPVEKWSHVAMTWDVKKAERKIFLDGKLVGEKGNAKPIPNAQNNFGIGKWAANFGWEDMFMGTIDDVKFWNRVLKADEIVQSSQPSTPVEPHGKLAAIWGNVKASR